MLLIFYGTRPEYIKLKPLTDLIKTPYKLVYIGQHKDLVEAENEDIEIVSTENRLNSVVSSVLRDDKIFSGATKVLVQGDTSSALAAALAAFHRCLPIYHLEAGLRTYDINNPYPEEFNRRCIANMSSYNFCPTQEDLNNLINERVPGRSFVVGNTVLDNLNKKGVKYTNKVLVTLHRRENHTLIAGWFSKLNALALEFPKLEFNFVSHPNPNISGNTFLLNDKIKVLDPLKYDDFIKLLKTSKVVISDSGGLQEECAFLNKRIIVCRKVTERAASLNQSSVLCPVPGQLPNIFRYVNSNYKINYSCPYGDGHAAEKIIELGVL